MKISRRWGLTVAALAVAATTGVASATALSSAWPQPDDIEGEPQLARSEQPFTDGEIAGGIRYVASTQMYADGSDFCLNVAWSNEVHADTGSCGIAAVFSDQGLVASDHVFPPQGSRLVVGIAVPQVNAVDIALLSGPPRRVFTTPAESADGKKIAVFASELRADEQPVRVDALDANGLRVGSQALSPAGE